MRTNRHGTRTTRGSSGRESDIHVFDFFSGCGGASVGFAAAGLVPVMAVDSDASAAMTYAANFPGATVLAADMRSLDPDAVASRVRASRPNPILFCACAPCQPFSKQNRQRKDGDDRASLIPEASRLIEAFVPEFVFAENVPGIAGQGGTGPYARFLATLDKLGYFRDAGVVNARDYGSSQARERLVLLASRVGPIRIPAPTHGDGLLPSVTVRDAIARFPPISAGESHPSIPNHRASRLSPANLERIRSIREGGKRTEFVADLRLDCHSGLDGYTDTYGRMGWDRAAPSLTTRCISFSNGRFGHPEQDRAISVREAAALQGFPDDFVFNGTMDGMAKQVGNAVPVPLARACGMEAIAVLDGRFPTEPVAGYHVSASRTRPPRRMVTVEPCTRIPRTT